MSTIVAGAALPIEEPIRAELFGIERLDPHAESLAAAERITDDGFEHRVQVVLG